MSVEGAVSIWDRSRLGITIGSVTLIFLAALEALAVTTVMPIVTADLGNEELFALAFSGTLATGVIGMVAAGIWSDRAGPQRPLYVAILLFTVGLIVSGAALDMYAFVVGRLIQGLGAGGQIVALYVVIARVYPRDLHGKVFAAFAAAWVVPSMVGPFLAGAVAEFLHWRYVFLGVAVVTLLTFILIHARLRSVTWDDPDPDQAPAGRTVVVRLALSVVVAAASVAAGFAAEAPSGAVGWGIAVASIAVVGFAVRPLFPPGTFRMSAGLPSVILTRGLVGGAFLAAEAFVPRLLMDRFEFGATVAGIALTLAALAWSLASFLQGRYGEWLGSARIVLIGIPLLIAGVGLLFAIAVTGRLPWLVIVAWGLAGAGMGLLYPRLTVLTLAYSDHSNEGFNSSALSISDSTGSAVMISVVGLAFLTLPVAGSGFASVFLVTLAIFLVSLVPGLRMGNAQAGG